MKKVKLLLSVRRHVEYYIDAVKAAGGEPTAICAPEIDTDYDGLILCGGGDIDPKYYGQGMNGTGKIDAERDAAEFPLLKAFLDAGKPVLGICRGLQLINVYFGGTLIQDIPEKELHTKKDNVDSVHQVTAVEGSILHKLYGSAFAVNSAHHQVIDELGESLMATAHWNDTHIEAIEHRTLPVYGVQWHPERMCITKKRDDTVDGLKIFEHFIDICKKP